MRGVINGNLNGRGHVRYLYIDWRIILKYILKKGCCEFVHWIRLLQDGDKTRVLVSKIINFGSP
jgi:hypothetical protein